MMTDEGQNQGRCQLTCPTWKLLEANVAAMNMHEGLPVGTHLHMAVMMMVVGMMMIAVMMMMIVHYLIIFLETLILTLQIFIVLFRCILYTSLEWDLCIPRPSGNRQCKYTINNLCLCLCSCSAQWDFHSSPRHRATKASPNHYNLHLWNIYYKTVDEIITTIWSV